MKTYKLFIRYWYGLRVEIVETSNIYTTIGEIYCKSIEKIERIDYKELEGGIAGCAKYDPVCAVCRNRTDCPVIANTKE